MSDCLLQFPKCMFCWRFDLRAGNNRKRKKHNVFVFESSFAILHWFAYYKLKSIGFAVLGLIISLENSSGMFMIGRHCLSTLWPNSRLSLKYVFFLGFIHQTYCEDSMGHKTEPPANTQLPSAALPQSKPKCGHWCVPSCRALLR